MFGFGKARKSSSSSMEETLKKAEVLGLLAEFEGTLLEEKEVRDLKNLEAEKHEVFQAIKKIQKKRDENLADLRKIWEDAIAGEYSPKHLHESHVNFEEERLLLAEEYDKYYGFAEEVEESSES